MTGAGLAATAGEPEAAEDTPETFSIGAADGVSTDASVGAAEGCAAEAIEGALTRMKEPFLKPYDCRVCVSSN